MGELPKNQTPAPQVATAGWGVGMAAGVAAGLSLLGLLSAGGAWNQTLDLLNHATPLYVVGGLLGLLIGACSRRLAQRRLLMALGLAGAVAAGLRVAPEVWNPSPAAPKGGPRLTLLTQNVWDANRDPHATARALAASGADIILLQELETPAARTVARDLERQYPYVADCGLVNRWCALAIVSRLPISTWSYHQGGWKAPDWDRLVLVRATIDSPVLGRFEVIDTKLVHPYSGDLQQSQIARLTDRVRGGDQDHEILTGDFNLTPWSFALGRIDRSIALIRRTRGLATWPNRLPVPGRPLLMPLAVLPIDQVYAGAAWRTVSVVRGPRTGSDHYGVLVTLVPSATVPGR